MNQTTEIEKIDLFYQQWRQILQMYIQWARDHDSTYNIIVTVRTLMQFPDGCTSKTICEIHGFPKQTISSILQDLSKRGWIEYLPSSQDKRSKLILLTDSGRLFGETISRELVEQDVKVFEKMGTAKLDTLTRILAEYIELYEQTSSRKDS